MWHTAKNLLYNLDPDEDTVWVLGAGASAHLGFPLGPQLCKNIIQNTSNSDSKTYTELLEMGFSGATICEFHQKLSKSIPRSIDEFLSDQPKLIEVGRAAIAQDLIRYEDQEALRRRDNNWYALLRNRVKAEIKRNRFSPVIVTFNYDLSLDKFLYDFISSTFSGYASIKSLEGIVRILHVHGRIGYLDYEKDQGPRRSYGRPAEPKDILAASRGIRVPSELADDYGRDMMVAKEAIKQAKRVIFLGFGYDKTNLARLDVDNCRTGKKWEGNDKYFGTAYKLGKTRIQELENLSEKRLSLGNPAHKIFDYLSKHNYL